MEVLNRICDGVNLEPLQQDSVEFFLTNKRVLFGHSTGLGKTYIYSACVRALVNKCPESKHVLVIIHDSIGQMHEKIVSVAKVPVGVVDATETCANSFLRVFDKSTIILMTYDVFSRLDVCQKLWGVLPKVMSFSLDEAHHASNWDTSDSAFMIRSFAKYAEYSCCLTATPAVTESKQFYRLMNLISRDLSPRRDETYLYKYRSRFFAVNRKDVGSKGTYRTELVKVQPTIDQIDTGGGIVFQKLKGTGAVNQVAALVRVLKKKLPSKCIVYIQYHDTLRWVEDNLRKEGIEFVTINGQVLSKDLRQQRMSQFKSEDGPNVLLTSISESIDIEADCIIFYEFNVRMKQVIGRAHRGNKAKDLDIVAIVTEGTLEANFFVENIGDRAESAASLLGLDYDEIIKLSGEVSKLTLDTDWRKSY